MHTILATTATGSVEVCLICNAIGPHAPGALPKVEGSQALSEPVDLVRGNQEVHLDVLVRENQALSHCVNEEVVRSNIIEEIEAEWRAMRPQDEQGAQDESGYVASGGKPWQVGKGGPRTKKVSRRDYNWNLLNMSAWFSCVASSKNRSETYS